MCKAEDAAVPSGALYVPPPYPPRTKRCPTRKPPPGNPGNTGSSTSLLSPLLQQKHTVSHHQGLGEEVITFNKHINPFAEKKKVAAKCKSDGEL